MATAVQIFESVNCKRCGGQGRVPWISTIEGSRCFGCGGSGKKLTARGTKDFAKYQAAYKACIVMKRPIDVQVGDKVKIYSDGRGPWYPVQSVKEETIMQHNGERLVEIQLPQSRWCQWPSMLVWTHPGDGMFPKAVNFDSRKKMAA